MTAALVCPCGARWKIVVDGAGDVVAACPVCTEAGRATSTHWRVAGRDYGWPGPPIPVELWIPLGQETPAGWFARFMDTSAQEEAHRVLVARRRRGRRRVRASGAESFAKPPDRGSYRDSDAIPPPA